MGVTDMIPNRKRGSGPRRPTAFGAFDEQGLLRTSAVLWNDPYGMGLYASEHEVRLLRVLPLQPHDLTPPSVRLHVRYGLEEALAQVGATSVAGTRSTAKANNLFRRFDLVAVRWHEPAVPPRDLSASARRFQSELLCDDQGNGYGSPRKLVFISFELWPDQDDTVNTGWLRRKIDTAIGQEGPDWDRYLADAEKLDSILLRTVRGRRPTDREASIRDAWFDPRIEEGVAVLTHEVPMKVDDIAGRLYPIGGHEIEMRQANDLGDRQRPGLLADWLADFTGPCVHITGELWPAKVVRREAKVAAEKGKSSLKETANAGDNEDGEVAPEELGQVEYAQHVEAMYSERSAPPAIGNLTVRFAHHPGRDGWDPDEMAETHGIVTQKLAGGLRAVTALGQMALCSPMRASNWRQGIDLGFLASSGITGFPNIGDRSGMFGGWALPDHVPFHIDVLGASRAETSNAAAMGVFAGSGSGKTVGVSALITSAVLDGIPAWVPNPKADDDLSTMVEQVGGTVLNMSQLERLGGALDACRYGKSPEDIAAQAMGHFAICYRDMTDSEAIRFAASLTTALRAGAQSVGVALRMMIDDPTTAIDVREHAKTLLGLAASSPQFGLGVSLVPVPRDDRTTGGLTVIQFDRGLGLPGEHIPVTEWSQTDRLAVAALRLVTRAGVYRLAGRKKGGIVVFEEAHHLLRTPDGLSVIELLGREARSQRILPIIVSQAPTDVTKVGLGRHMSRVLVGKLRTDSDYVAAAQLCGLDPDEPGVLSMFQGLGLQPSTPTSPASSVWVWKGLRDGELARVRMGPYPKRWLDAWRTDSDIKAEREAGAA